MPFITSKHKGLIFDSTTDANFTGNGIHCYGGVKYFQANFPTGANGTLETYDIGQSIGIYSSNDAGTQYTELAIDQNNLTIIANNATLSNITVWGSDSILTQGRGDGRYVTPSCLTYSNITGTPNLSLYLTTADAASTYATISSLSSYLPSANFTYANIGGTIPTATNTTLGAIKVGSNLTISNGTLSASIPAAGFTNGDTLNGGSY
jgi:hypothetical protein